MQVSRRALSLGARASWLKIKCVKRGVFLIIGFIPPPVAIATLHLARRAGKALAYGRDGFTQKSARELRQVLEALATDRSPVQGAPLRPKSTWVRPGLSPAIEYTAVTREGLRRHVHRYRCSRRCPLLAPGHEHQVRSHGDT